MTASGSDTIRAATEFAPLTDQPPPLTDDVFVSVLEHMLNGVAYCRMLFENGRPADFIYLYTNPAFHRQTGLGPVAGKRVSEAIPGMPASDPQLMELYGRVAAGGGAERFETFVAALGNWFSVEVFSPRPEHFVAVFDVITERRRIEEQLRLQSLVLDQIEDKVTVTDLAGVVTYVNQAEARALDAPGETRIGRHVSVYGDGPEADATQQQIVEATLRNGAWRGRVMNIRADGSPMLLNLRTTLVRDADGRPVAMVGIGTDITERQKAEEALSEHEERLRLALSAADQAWFDVDLLTGRIDVSPEYSRMIGAEPEEAGTSLEIWLGHVHPEDRAQLAAAFQACVANGGPESMEYRRQTKAGKWKWIQSIGRIVAWTSDGKAARMIGIHTDVTERKRTEAAVAAARTQLQATLDAVPDLLFEVGADGCIHDYHSPRVELLAAPPQDFLGKRFRDTIPADAADVCEAALREAQETGRSMGRQYQLQLPQGQCWFELSVSRKPVMADEEPRFILLARDITARKTAEDQVRQLAFYDALTALPNRRLLNDRLRQAMAANRRSGCYGALMFLDLDNFKSLNDAYGHEVGDLLLVEVAHRLTGCVREMDTVARFGGDEFVVMIGELDVGRAESVAQAGVVAEKILVALANPYRLGIQPEGQAPATIEHLCTVSIGVALFGRNDKAPDQVIRWADKAMYQAKDSGRNAARFYGGTA